MQRVVRGIRKAAHIFQTGDDDLEATVAAVHQATELSENAETVRRIKS